MKGDVCCCCCWSNKGIKTFEETALFAIRKVFGSREFIFKLFGKLFLLFNCWGD